MSKVVDFLMSCLFYEPELCVVFFKLCCSPYLWRYFDASCYMWTDVKNNCKTNLGILEKNCTKFLCFVWRKMKSFSFFYTIWNTLLLVTANLNNSWINLTSLFFFQFCNKVVRRCRFMYSFICNIFGRVLIAYH